MAEEMLNSPLFNLNNQFYFGAYQTVINESTKLQRQLSDPFKLELQLLVYRSYLALNKINIVYNELKANSNLPIELQAFKLYVEVILDKTSSSSKLEELNQIANDGKNLLNVNLQIIYALAVYQIDPTDANCLKAVSLHPQHLESVALKIQLLLNLNRVDLATKELAKAKSWAEDVPLIQLMEGYLALRLSGNKLSEALAIFEDLSGSSNTVKFLNLKAASLLNLGNYDEADEVLLQALEKDNSYPDTLANLIVSSSLNYKPEEVRTRYINQLRDVDPNHQILVNLDSKDKLFDECSKKYTSA